MRKHRVDAEKLQIDSWVDDRALDEPVGDVGGLGVMNEARDENIGVAKSCKILLADIFLAIRSSQIPRSSATISFSLRLSRAQR